MFGIIHTFITIVVLTNTHKVTHGLILCHITLFYHSILVGRQMQDDGICSIIKVIGSAMDQKNGHVIYLNLKAPPASWARHFSLFVEGDCQVFANAAMDALTATDKPKEDWFTYIKKVERRRDMRPLWDWV
ncbi:hypothetical protein BYT27DRAFT_7261690 [Phlegmacium glaucopus]|nr:hypothetical protein BYT27DRAFT_7261690 [Phlegmacium glaucopus]